ncbi:MAG: outer membrane protein assembly factor BamC, partial [Rubrivivax sp.]|nr:outer membrane protein assembly factor BamC [Rubrivivax sp.]
MNPLDAVIPFRLRTLALAALAAVLASCTSTDGLFSGEKVDYKSTTASTKPLEVPPDLTQLARESRYQPRGGVVSASTAAAAAPATATTTAAPVATSVVALRSSGDLRIERQGQLRWLVTSQTPEQLWPLLRAFWEKSGFTLDVEN